MINKKWLKQLPIQNIKKVTPVSGGDINDSYCIQTNNQKYFMKVQPNRGKEFFSHEVEGLKLLNKAANVPKIITYGEIESDGYLILKWLDSGHGSQYKLGQMVANVHQIHNNQFGLDNNFTLGKLPKINTWTNNWSKFYIRQRLDPLVNIAKQNNLWNSFREKHYKNLKEQFIDYYNQRNVKPSLLHGDLWSGNYEFSAQGIPVLIDPDVVYGDRELDLAMTTIFGGFSNEFYQGYNDTYPLDSGFKQRLPWYRLYYLLEHLNLFGEMYGMSVDNTLNNF